MLAAVEGASSYGAGITDALLDGGFEVAEVRPAARCTHPHSGKFDALDAGAAARSVLGREVEALARPRRTGPRAGPAVLLASRSIIDQQRTANRNALTALHRPGHRCPHSAKARRLAATVLEQTELLGDNHRQLRRLADELTPGLQDIRGMGPVTAAIIVCAYSHRGRVRSEAAVAALGGIAPLPASSGNTTRHRLSRSGDRQLNRAFDVIVRSRMSYDPDTRAYLARRTAEGMTRREIRRCLKRYVCRAVFRQLQTCIA